MMNWIRNLSLKFKLILLLVLLTGSVLSAYGFLALRDFEKDKIAYVLDSSLAQSRSVALQIRAEMGYVVDRVKFFMRGYANETRAFHPFSVSIFPQENQFEACLAFHRDDESGFYKLGGVLKKNISDMEFDGLKKIAEKLTPAILEREIAIFRSPQGSKWILGLRFDRKGDSPLIVISSLSSGHFLGLFDSAQMQDTYLLADNTQTVMSPQQKTYQIPESDILNAFQHTTEKLKSPEGTYQYPSANSDIWLISLASVGFGNLKIMSVVPRKAALEAVKLVMIKSALFLVLLFFITVFLSVLASTSLTASLKKLNMATKEISQGNFSVSVDIQGRDEIGSLSDGFNKMAFEIKRLMKETAEKARMESELKTARLVQSTLFPKDHLIESDIEILGSYLPASECSGDWWYYKRIGHQTLFCIGDATGHGVPAALLTAAARSAASALETFPELPLTDMMTIFNRAIYNTANGQVMMTLFLGAYDHHNAVITYANASHEPPYLLPQKEKITKKDILLLNESNGPRLGEDPNSLYTSTQVQLKSGERIILYTDGVTELQNKKGDLWGERAFVNLLIKCSNEEKGLNETMNSIAQELSTFREDHPLHDDVTYFMVSRPKAA